MYSGFWEDVFVIGCFYFDFVFRVVVSRLSVILDYFFRGGVFVGEDSYVCLCLRLGKFFLVRCLEEVLEGRV